MIAIVSPTVRRRRPSRLLPGADNAAGFRSINVHHETPGVCCSVLHRSASCRLSGMQALESTPRGWRLPLLSVPPKYQTTKARLPHTSYTPPGLHFVSVPHLDRPKATKDAPLS